MRLTSFWCSRREFALRRSRASRPHASALDGLHQLCVVALSLVTMTSAKSARARPSVPLSPQKPRCVPRTPSRPCEPCEFSHRLHAQRGGHRIGINFTVRSVLPRSTAICLFSRPRTTCRSTSYSRGVSAAKRSRAGQAPVGLFRAWRHAWLARGTARTSRRISDAPASPVHSPPACPIL
jgi:hypothetical protein